MQDIELFNNMPPTLAEKVQEYANQTEAKARGICSRNSVPQDVADVFIADAIDILRARYDGLRATTEQMRTLTEKVQQRSWARTENAALGLMAQYYAGIKDIMDGSRAFGYNFADVVVVCEIIKRMPEALQDETDGKEDIQTWTPQAQRLYYTLAILIAGEWCNATEDELRGVQPYGVEIPAEKTAQAIAGAMDMRRQRERIMQAEERRKRARAGLRYESSDDDTGLFNDAPGGDAQAAGTAPAPREKTITQFQTMAYMLAGGSDKILTADARNDGRTETPQPLWQAIARQKQAAQALLDSPDATDEEKRQAAQMITNTYAVTQVLDGLQILPQVLPPDSGTTSRMIWDMTTYQYARTILRVDSPKAEQVMALLRATAFLSTQRTTAVEKTTKRTTYIDENGVRKSKITPREVHTNFQPVVVEFRSEYEDKVLVEDATRIRIEVHRLFIDGRSADYVGSGKQRERIAAPQRQYLTIGQYYDFSDANERIFRNIILSKPKQAEDAMLSAVFGYPQRQAEQNEKAAAARAIAQQTRAAADAMAANPTATQEQKAEAMRQAKAAEETAKHAAAQAKYYITNHLGDDVKRLKRMFEKAQRNGLINSYYDTGRNDGGKVHYGRGVVWYWLRGKNSGK